MAGTERGIEVLTYDLTDFVESALCRAMGGGLACLTAGTASEAVRLAEAHHPRLILLDHRTERDDPAGFIARLAAAAPCARLCVLTDEDDPARLYALFRPPVAAVLRRTQLSVARLVATARALLDGFDGVASDGYVMAPLLDAAAAGLRSQSPPALSVLTEAERDLLFELARGSSEPAAAGKLLTSRSVVQRRLRSMRRRTRARSLGELFILAERMGVFSDLEPPPEPEPG